jgi:hypothetical protein
MMEEQMELALSQVSLENFINYLQSKGWRQIKYEDELLDVYTKPDKQSERPFVVTLPKSQHGPDYAARIEEAIERLSLIENRSFDAIWRNIQTINLDVISIRLVIERDEYPSVDRAKHFIDGMRELIAWGASMELRQQRYFPQPARQGREQAQHFKLAHTYSGSFGFTFESHLSGAYQLPIWSHYQDLPLARRVLERITRGFLFTRQAEQDHSSQVISERFAQGFNGNMCNAALEMLKDIRNGAVIYDVSWSSIMKASHDVAQFEPVVLKRDAVYYLQEAAKYLEKTGLEDLKGLYTVEGPVIGLSYDGQGTREIMMQADGVGKVEMVLDEEAYQRAGQAHLREQRITVTGQLSKRGRRGPYILTSPRDLHLLEG